MGSSARVLLIIILMNLLWYFRACYRLICVLVLIFQCFLHVIIVPFDYFIISCLLCACVHCMEWAQYK